MKPEPQECPSCKDQAGMGDDCKLLQAAYILAGLSMMLNIRLAYSSAPYALIRFKLPENLFSVFVRRMASALELWCLPSMLLGNIMDYGLKGYYKSQGYTQDFNNKFNLRTKEYAIITTTKDKKTTIEITFDTSILTPIGALTLPRLIKFGVIIGPSILAQWLNFLTYVILFFVYVAGGDQGHLTTFYWVIAISGVVFGINMVLVYAADWNYTPVYIVGENSFPIVTSAMHYISTLMFGNRRKWDSDFILVLIDIWVAIIISFVAAILWTVAYGHYRNTKKEVIIGYNIGPATTVTIKDCSTRSATTVGTNGTIAPITNPTEDTGATLTINNITATDGALKTTSGSPLDASVSVDTNKLTINYEQDGSKKCIEINLNTAATKKSPATIHYGHIFAFGFGADPNPHLLSPFLMIVVGMGLVYAIYPGIAPGMIVPFYLIDKIEMVLLVATLFPPVIIALLRKYPSTQKYSPQYFKFPAGFQKWTDYPAGKFYLFLDILMIIKILLAAIFIYSLHYRESNISRAIINQPKMSTFLSITFYMCHEILLALGFSGFIGNNGGDLILVPQYIGALFMIFLAFYSEGYIIEYKSHDP